jgi:hypothetical protein
METAKLGKPSLRLEIAKQLLLLMDTEQEQRSLMYEEIVFRRYLKAKAVSLAAILHEHDNTPD